MSIRKHQLVWTFVFLSFLAGTLIFAGRASAETLGFSLSAPMDREDRRAMDIAVLDEASLAPVEDAVVTVSNRNQGAAQAGTLTIKTDGDGMASVPLPRGAGSPDDSWMVTVHKDGYSKTTLAGVRSWEVTVFLKPLPPLQPDVVASGRFGGWKPAPWGSNVVQAGLVIRTISAMDLLDFQVSSLISPMKDTIDVFGPREIPSNVVLPKQDIFLPIGIIRLNKPIYRLPVPHDESIRLAGVQGQMDVSDILPVFRGGGKFDLALLNDLKFTRVGMTQKMRRDSDFEASFDATTDLRRYHDVQITAPSFAADVVTVAATDLTGDRSELVPTDVKTAMKKEEPGRVRRVSLRSASGIGSVRNVVSIAIADSGKKLSGIVSSNAGRSVRPGEFLDVQEVRRELAARNVMTVHAPANGVGVLVLKGERASERYIQASGARRPLWSVYVLPAAGTLEVPVDQMRQESPEAVSLVQLDFGNSFEESSIDGGSIMTRLERFTHHWREVGSDE